MGYAPPFTYRITIEGLEGHHGEGSDAQQQRKEEAEAGQEQEERCRSVRHAQPGQTRHLVHEPIRQEALAGDHVLVPLGRDPYCARSTLETEMPTGTVKWFNPTKGYGFIQPSGGGGKDVFVHISAVERAGLRSLNEGQTVEYEIQSERGKESATNLRVK